MLMVSLMDNADAFLARLEIQWRIVGKTSLLNHGITLFTLIRPAHRPTKYMVTPSL